MHPVERRIVDCHRALGDEDNTMPALIDNMRVVATRDHNFNFTVIQENKMSSTSVSLLRYAQEGRMVPMRIPCNRASTTSSKRIARPTSGAQLAPLVFLMSTSPINKHRELAYATPRES
jgi:hypothetical protein